MRFSVSFFLSILLTPFLSFSAVEGSKPAADKPKVLIEEAKFSADQKRILVPAKVEAKVQSTVTADIEGHVVQVLKPIGAVVRAGEVVLYLENRDPGFTYARVPVRAPIQGVISQLGISQMSKVSRGDKLFTVIDPKSLKLSVEFPSLDSNLVQPGTVGTFKFAMTENKIRILGISPLIDARTGTASAELEFLPAEKNLPAIGTIGQASFDMNQGQVLLIPENSLFYQDGKPLVRVIKGNDQIEKKPIELGEQREGLFVVKSGITAGDKVVVRSSRPIKDGEAIEIEKPETVKQ